MVYIWSLVGYEVAHDLVLCLIFAVLLVFTVHALFGCCTDSRRLSWLWLLKGDALFVDQLFGFFSPLISESA